MALVDRDELHPLRRFDLYGAEANGLSALPGTASVPAARIIT